MTVNSVKTNEDKRVELEIAVGAEEFGKAVDAAFAKNAKKIQIPGFRRGHAPRKMIEKMYGEGVFYEEAINNTYPAAYEEAVKEAKIEPVDRADIEVLNVGKDGFTFKAIVAVKPEVSLEGYKGIAVEKKIYQATDEEVEAELNRMRQQNARMLTVEGRGAQEGDTVVFDFEGFMDGKPFEGGKAEKYPLVLGLNSFIPGFEDQIIGHNAGDEFEVNVTFPEDYHAEELKGKPAVFKCKLHEVQLKELPEIDDEFAKDVSEFDSLDELKADLKEKAQKRHDDQSQTEVENKLMEEVCGKMVADIPQCMFDNRVEEMTREFEYRLQSQGMDLKTYLKYTEMEPEAFKKTFAPQAEAQVKTRLALEKIVELENIQPTEEELNAEYEKIAKSYNMETDKVKEIVPPEELSININMGKALDLVRDTAVITEVKAEEASEEKKEEKPKKASKPRAKKAKAVEAEDQKDASEATENK